MKEILSDNFISAARDYFLLQEKEYPQRLIFKIICDRYSLNTIQRVVLYRGVFPSREAEKRKLAQVFTLHKVNLSVDVSNVIFKLSNYLCGRPVFLCNDNLLRDAGDAFDKDYSSEILTRSVKLMTDYLYSLSLISVKFIIDKPLDSATIIRKEVNHSLDNFKFPVEIEEVYPADHFLEGPEPRVIATADSDVIDRLSCPFIDIPHLVLQMHYNPEFLNISEILMPELF